MSAPTTVQERREALRAAKAELEKKREEKRVENETALLELELKCEAELGARGAQFEILDLTSLDEGFVVVKRGDSVVYKRFTASKKEDADVENYVIPNLVSPTADEFRALCIKIPNVLGRAALAVDRLYGAKANEDEGKF